ncbi:sulfur carrier protein ThiS [Bacillus sp. FJAT-45037]|uniref:sulfur carrier protein ThiS n=1 Tax=Bacillus sp. FJAT-45037 TaxID=2011007 RepID=UPI000C244992|nr:sulfur carrier protein ThiS [Bacillus sp. FJAT-45037]
MELIINGKEQQVEAETLQEVVIHFNLESHLVVTEVDGVIIDREKWGEMKVTPGMKIELVHFVGGG